MAIVEGLLAACAVFPDTAKIDKRETLHTNSRIRDALFRKCHVPVCMLFSSFLYWKRWYKISTLKFTFLDFAAPT